MIGGLEYQFGEKRNAREFFDNALKMVRDMGPNIADRHDYRLEHIDVHLLWLKFMNQQFKQREKTQEEFDLVSSNSEQCLNELNLLLEVYQGNNKKQNIAVVKYKIGLRYLYLDNYQNALNYFEQSLKMYTQVYGENVDHPNIANTLNSMAICYDQQKQYKKAIEKYKEALAMFESCNPKKEVVAGIAGKASIAQTQYDLGCCQRRIGNLESALNSVNQSYILQSEIYGKFSVHAGKSLLEIGLIYEAQRKYILAARELEKARVIASSMVGYEDDVNLFRDRLDKAIADNQWNAENKVRVRQIF